MTVHALTRDALSLEPLPEPPENEDKHARGTLLVVAGGARVPGAAVLTGRAGLRVGAGRLQLAAARASAIALGLAVPEAAVFWVRTSSDGELGTGAVRDLGSVAAEADAIVVGPGLLRPKAAAAMAEDLLRANMAKGVVVDAAALPGLAAGTFGALARGRVVLTPHAGEMARMMDADRTAVTADPLGYARRAAERFTSVVVMKGATTYVATPAGRAWRHEGGVVGLATSGSGDVLAGVIGGLLARGAAAETAALWGVHLHAQCGKHLTEILGPVGFLASDVIDVLPTVLPR